MKSELFFIYDSHCPWSYASTALVNEIVKAYPETNVHLWHVAHYDGSDCAGAKQADTVSRQSAANFGMEYIKYADTSKNASMAANFMAWICAKQQYIALDVLNELQKQHFVDNVAFIDKDDFEEINAKFKLSPPAKVFKNELSKESNYVLAEIVQMQEIIRTEAFPALLLAVDDNLVMLNHNLYLTKPSKIIEAVELEHNR
ncbi:protein-disulfide isomerase [Thalassotalea crassostreae]|uniref:protein-disulfide isomerase n=1 Tax=Thalassotalea crassostreae TaxID=1763536 RepID=UPI000838C57C|nr:protein-disulfide isomerase [Thalassotalea crassostreae]